MLLLKLMDDIRDTWVALGFRVELLVTEIILPPRAGILPPSKKIGGSRKLLILCL